MTSSAEEPPEVQVKLLRSGARAPFRASASATGWDLYAWLGEPVRLGPRPTVVPTGIALAVPEGLDAQIRPRSGLARNGVIATFGTLDADYRGEVMVTLYTTSADIDHVVRHGDRVAQIVFARVAHPGFTIVEDLDATERGGGGHGSTGT